MKLSVVIPAYNLESYIVECVDSVITQQTEFEFEVLVGDDASTDKTWQCLQHYRQSLGSVMQSRLHLRRAATNAGLVTNLTDLFQRCRGEYIAYLDGDDVALPGKLQRQVAYLDQHPDCALVYHESEMFDSVSGKTTGHYSADFYNATYIPPQADIEHLVRYGTFFQASSVMFRHHDRMSRILDPRCRIIVDYPMHMFNAFYGGGTIDRVDEVLGRYRLHVDSFGAQTSRSVQRREVVLGELLIACDNALKMGVDKQAVNAGKAHFRFAAALYFLRLGEDALFNRYIEQSAMDNCFFDERHREVYRLRESPDSARYRFGFEKLSPSSMTEQNSEVANNV